jgi:hypothetical protein
MSQTASKPKYRCQDVDAFLQTLPGTTSSRVRRQKTMWFACWEHLRTGEPLFDAKWVRMRMGPVYGGLHQGYQHDGGADAIEAGDASVLAVSIEPYSEMRTRELIDASHEGAFSKQDAKTGTEITPKDQRDTREPVVEGHCFPRTPSCPALEQARFRVDRCQCRARLQAENRD